MIKCLRLRYASGLAGFISQENRLKNHIHTIYGVTRQPAWDLVSRVHPAIGHERMQDDGNDQFSKVNLVFIFNVVQKEHSD